MRTWLLRGGVLAVVHAVAETVRADFGVHHPTSRTVFEAIMLGLLVAVSAVWAATDVWRDVPERARMWLIASLITGWGAAILGVIGKAIFVDQTGVADLGNALSGGAAFTALLVLISAAIGSLAGRWIRMSNNRTASASDDEDADDETETETETEDEDEDETDEDAEPAQRGGPTKSTPRS